MSDLCQATKPFVGAPRQAPVHRCKRAPGHKGRHRCACIRQAGLRCDVSWRKTFIVEKSQVRINAEKDPEYAPYCLRCPGLVRMVKIGNFLWGCSCGARHDEREG